MKFLVTINERLSRSFVVEANSDYEAHDLVKRAYQNEEIILDYDDYCDNNIDTQALTQKELDAGFWDDHPTWPPMEDTDDV